MVVKINTVTAIAEDNLHCGLASKDLNNRSSHQLFKQSNILSATAFVFLTYNAGIAIYRSKDNPWDLAFLIPCYVELIVMYLCLKKYELNPGAGMMVQDNICRLLISIWFVSFAYRVSLIMSLSIKFVIWGMIGSVIAAGFYAFLIFDKQAKGENGYGELDKVEEKDNIYHNQSFPQEKV